MMEEINAKQNPEIFTKKWTLVVIACTMPIFLMFAFLWNNPGKGRAAAICTGVIMFAARGCWNLRKHTWFWVTLAIIISLHVLLVLLVPWTSKSYPGLTLFPVGVLDYAIVYGSIKLAEKVMSRGHAASSPS